MPKLDTSASFDALSDAVTARLRKYGVKLTIGGEPSYVPLEPAGSEWSITALGPTKLGYAYALANALIDKAVPGAVAFFSPGKIYPGEINPRWTIHLVWNRDGSRIDGSRNGSRPLKTDGKTPLSELRKDIAERLKVKAYWHRLHDSNLAASQVWVLPLDHDGERWLTEKWPSPSDGKWTLLNAEGPAGLRLPLGALPQDSMKRALVLEMKADGLHVFLPPLLQQAFLQLLKVVSAALRKAKVSRYFYEGYVPGDDNGSWSKLSLAADPGVLEINLPPCEGASEYGWWMEHLEECAAVAGLRSFKQPSPDEVLGTGGGNHLLFGGPTLDENAFFKHPQWVTSILRYWQHHPSLSYMFTGSYVGASSQAPRPDETSGELYDLEMAYQFLEKLEPGNDHRFLISETLRHLHIDRSGNTHRSEVSFDKFWNIGWDGGCRGLMEFRAVETMPHARWMTAVALLWTSLAAYLFEKSFSRPLIDHGVKLHDSFFLPTPLWDDLELVLRNLRQGGYPLPEDVFREIWNYRFPQLLDFSKGRARLSVRKGLEGWPLLCETPLEGGNTSRYVDTSMERLEFTANQAFADRYRVSVQGRQLELEPYPGNQLGAGLRYRRSALHPSLHPGITPHIPLVVTIEERAGKWAAAFRQEANRRIFEILDSESDIPVAGVPCKKLRPELLTYDLRL